MSTVNNIHLSSNSKVKSNPPFIRWGGSSRGHRRWWTPSPSAESRQR